MIRVGLLDVSDELLGFYEGHAGRLGRRSALAASSRCRGLSLAARGDFDGAGEAAERSVSLFEQLSMPFDVARSRLALGEVHRRARRKRLASENLLAAESIFVDLGAPLWVALAREERARIGLRSAVSAEGAALTQAERQVADLVASGLTNAEVAGRLFMAQRTVEAHLSKVYRKLGVSSRAQLARMHETTTT